MYAFVMATVSGLSLPIGAYLGIALAPVRQKLCAQVLAFGAGSLTFAVCVEIYAEGIREYAEGETNLVQALAAVVAGVFGALFFLNVERLLSGHSTVSHEENDAEAVKSKAVATDAPSTESFRPTEGLLQQAPGRDSHALGRGERTRSWIRAHSLAEIENAKDVEKRTAVAYSLFLGLLIDGVPSGIFMGLLGASGELCLPLVISLLIANFPEAFSSASLLANTKASMSRIVGMWTCLCLLTGVLAGVSCSLLLTFFPEYEDGAKLPSLVGTMVTSINGFTGGAMLAFIMKVMVPEATERLGKIGDPTESVGFISTLGFLFSVTLSVLFPSQ